MNLKQKKEALDFERNFKMREECNLDMAFGEFFNLYSDDVQNRLKRNTWLTKEHIVRTKILPYNEDGSDIKETNGDISQLISVLYEIQDDISRLKNEIHNKDTETIQAIVKASTPVVPMEDSNATIMKTIIPELLKNPNSMKALIELSEWGNKKK